MCRAATPYANPNTWSTSALGLRSARRAAAGAPLGSARLGATCACSGEWGGLCALALRRAVLTLSRSESVRYSGVRSVRVYHPSESDHLPCATCGCELYEIPLYGFRVSVYS